VELRFPPAANAFDSITIWLRDAMLIKEGTSCYREKVRQSILRRPYLVSESEPSKAAQLRNRRATAPSPSERG